MNIVIQGSQGCGKTTVAEHIAMMYHKDHVVYITEYPSKKLCFDTVLNFLREPDSPEYARKDKALIVFDQIPSAEILKMIIARMNEIKQQYTFVDTIYITQFKISII